MLDKVYKEALLHSDNVLREWLKLPKCFQEATIFTLIDGYCEKYEIDHKKLINDYMHDKAEVEKHYQEFINL